jgi:hypothetical protein
VADVDSSVVEEIELADDLTQRFTDLAARAADIRGYL